MPLPDMVDAAAHRRRCYGALHHALPLLHVLALMVTLPQRRMWTSAVKLSTIDRRQDRKFQGCSKLIACDNTTASSGGDVCKPA